MAYSAVTAVYRGTPKNGSSVLLRSYDSRREPPPEFNCAIWQAGRATCATGLAFKPIQIGQLVFHDEGAGKYNPAPQVLDEAVCNEWPGREVGVFVSVGTGKRPPGTSPQQHLWWEGFVSSQIGDFAEARRRLIAKIEGCEETHQYMLKEHLSKRHVNPENYYRLNVEVGVGEFGMNEWNRLVEISTNTHRYLGRSEVQSSITTAATKMAKVHNAHARQAPRISGMEFEEGDEQRFKIAHPLAVELPGAEIDLRGPYNQSYRPSSQPQQQPPPPPPPPPLTTKISSATPNVTLYGPTASHQDKYTVISTNESEAPQVVSPISPPQPPPLPRRSNELAPGGGRRSNEFYSSPARSSMGSFVPSPRRSSEYTDAPRPSVSNAMQPTSSNPTIVPPRPPKTPLPYPDMDARANEHRPYYSTTSLPSTITTRPPQPPPRVLNGNLILPYPDLDGPPPAVNLARKPEYRAI